jgi:hypothetical protein
MVPLLTALGTLERNVGPVVLIHDQMLIQFE